MIRTLLCWVLSKEISSTIFCVFGMTVPEIEPWSLWLLLNTLSTRPMGWCSNIDFVSHLTCVNGLDKYIFLKCSNLVNKLISSPICNWIKNLPGGRNLYLCWAPFFNHPNSLCNKDKYEMLIRILHSFLNRSISIIMDWYLIKNHYNHRLIFHWKSNKSVCHLVLFKIIVALWRKDQVSHLWP